MGLYGYSDGYMNRIKCFLEIHKWMSIARKTGKAQMYGVLSSNLGQQDAVLCVDRCIHCGKETAYMSTCHGNQSVGLEYAKGILGIK
jgi:hypothetical protein